MVIQIFRPVYAVDDSVHAVFMDIYNALSGATSAAEMNRVMLHLENRRAGPRPGRFFIWGFHHDVFWLKQRVLRDSEDLFDQPVLKVVRYTSPEQLCPVE